MTFHHARRMEMDEQALRVFTRGFVVMLIGVIIFAAIARPDTGFAQGGNRNPNNVAVDVESTANQEPLYTDDPLGRVVIPLDEGEPPLTKNGEGESVASPPVVDRTDDPTSREQIPLTNGQATGEAPLPLDTAAESPPLQEASVYGSPLVIPAADFRSDGLDPDSSFFFFSGGYLYGEHSDTCLMAPVYLPDGATIEEVYASVYDNDSNSGVNLWLKLYRVNNYSGSSNILAAMETASESTNLQVIADTSINYPTIVHPDYSYYLGVCLESANIRLYSVRIYY
jgi:hypothetical protein